MTNESSEKNIIGKGVWRTQGGNEEHQRNEKCISRTKT
jgi:hypothetical protein